MVGNTNTTGIKVETDGSAFVLTDTTNFGILSVQMYRMGNMRMLSIALSTKTALSVGTYTIGTIIAKDRPLFDTSNYIGRADSGSQGTGTITVQTNGNISYGVNINGASGVTIRTQITWFV